MREYDERDIELFVRHSGHLIPAGFWMIFRRGSSGRPIRVKLATPDEQRARKQYAETVRNMRQGSAALVSPDHKLVAYACEPMVRTRW